MRKSIIFYVLIIMSNSPALYGSLFNELKTEIGHASLGVAWVLPVFTYAYCNHLIFSKIEQNNIACGAILGITGVGISHCLRHLPLFAHPIISLIPAFATASVFSHIFYKKKLSQLINKQNKLSKSLITGVIYSTLYCEATGLHNAAVTISILGSLIALGIREPEKIIIKKRQTFSNNKFTCNEMIHPSQSHYYEQ